MGQVAPADYTAVLGQFLGLDGAAAAEVAGTYPLSDYDGSTSWALSSVLTDWSWGCTAEETNRLLARHVPTYSFQFADRTAPWFADTPQPDFPTGAHHAAELQYLFSGAYAGAALSPEQQRLADEMIGYWTRFAHTGDPNGNGSPSWPRYQDSGHTLSLATGPGGIGTTDLSQEHRCEFWNTVG